MRGCSIFLWVITSMLLGCANQSDRHVDEDVALTGTWRVEDINGGGVIDRSQVTINVEQQGKIHGSTGCNRYSGKLALGGAAFLVSDVATTRRACAPAIAKQEQRFLDALNEATSYKFDAGIWIVVYDKSGEQRLKLIKTAPVAGSKITTQDSTRNTPTRFRCEGVGDVTVRFVDDDTIALSGKHSSVLLPRMITASGAQYGNEKLRFWNKGDEARLYKDGQNYRCQQIDKTSS